MVIYGKTPGSYASFNPQFFLYASETTIVIWYSKHLPSFPALHEPLYNVMAVTAPLWGELRETKSFELQSTYRELKSDIKNQSAQL